MTVRDTPWAPGTPCWIDLNTSDIEAAKTFYGGLFGWQLQVSGEETGGYVVAEIGGHAVAGLMGQMPESAGQPSVWMTYFATEDADATVTKITDAGGTIVVEPMDVLDIGRMVVALDPTGAPFGLWQARSFSGAQLANEPGAYTWNELYTRDFARAKEFYGAVFGYTLSDVAPGMDYVTIDLDGRPVGGIGAMPADAPSDAASNWRVYFFVEDTDQAVEQATKLGGKVVQAAQDSPYGRWADVADGQGARFSVIKPPAEAGSGA